MGYLLHLASRFSILPQRTLENQVKLMHNFTSLDSFISLSHAIDNLSQLANQNPVFVVACGGGGGYCAYFRLGAFLAIRMLIRIINMKHASASEHPISSRLVSFCFFLILVMTRYAGTIQN